MLSVTCPSCHTDMHLMEQLAGKVIRCKHCQQVFKVGAPTGPEATPSNMPVQPAPVQAAKGTNPQESLRSRPGNVPTVLQLADPSPSAGRPRPSLEEDTPREQKQNSSLSIALIILGIIAGVFVLLGIVAAAVALFIY